MPLPLHIANLRSVFIARFVTSVCDFCFCVCREIGSNYWRWEEEEEKIDKEVIAWRESSIAAK